MISRNRDLLQTADSRCRIALAIVVWSAVAGWCGMTTRTDFNPGGSGGLDSNVIITAQGVGLAIQRSATIKLFGDTLPGAPNRSSYPDVVSRGIDTFDIFYVDTLTTNFVATQRIRLLPNGSAIANSPVKAFDTRYVVPGSYLHVDKRTGGYCASLVQKEGNYPFLTVHNGSIGKNIDTTGSRGWLQSSQCALGGTTFCNAYSMDATTTIIKKVMVGASSIQVVGTDTVFTETGTSTNSLLNCAVAADRNGTICVIAMHGGPAVEKKLRYKLYDSTLTPIPGSEYEYPTPVADNGFYYYDDVGIVSYAPGKFAAVSWDPSGVLLHYLSFDGTTVSHTVNRIISQSDIMFCTIAASSKYLVVACIGDVDGNGVRCVEGIRYMIVNDVPDSAQAISFSDPAVPVITVDTAYSSAMNSTIDDSGAIALVWRNQYKVAGCIWAHRSIRYKKAFYQSPVDSLPIANDSLRFDPAIPQLSNDASWYIDSYLRFGVTPAACAIAPWLSFSDSSVLANNPTVYRYFQYRLYLNRSATGIIDSFSTPYLSSVTVSWNAQPRLLRIDSVTNAGIRYLGVASGDTLSIISRSDTSRITSTVYDSDTGDLVTISPTLDAIPTSQALPGGSEQVARSTLNPFLRSDTVYRCVVNLHDQHDWQGVPVYLYYRTFNVPPRVILDCVHRDGRSGTQDTLPVTVDTTLIAQQEDTLLFRYMVADSNDRQTVYGRIVHGTEVIDSTGPAAMMSVALVADSLQPVDTLHFRVEAVDPDTTVSRTVHLIVNHKPIIRGIIYDNDTLYEGDTANVVIDSATELNVMVADTDCYFGDTLHYQYRCGTRQDSVITPAIATMMTFVPDSVDTVITFSVRDRFGRSDSLHIYLAFPWLETDSSQNPEFTHGVRRLSDSITLIAGSEIADTLYLPMRNTGRNELIIATFRFLSGREDDWVRVTAVDDSGNTFSVTPVKGLISRQVTIAPDSTIVLQFRLTAHGLIGDTLRYDTLVMTTNDPRHKKVSIPIRLEHNDLPQIVTLAPYFIADVPYRPVAKRAAYNFPPHAVIALSFSEPMDTAGAAAGITIYSAFDKMKTGIMQPIPFQITWLQNATVVHLTPDYDRSSPTFGVQPPQGLFIPTDSLVITISSVLHDQARTPSGPNALDIDRNFIRDSGTDTSIALRVDSISFTIASIEPSPGSDAIDRDATITLIFSAPVYAASVDTSLVNNRSFSVRSEYNGFEMLPFSTITVDSQHVTFRLHRELFYRDSLVCRYQSQWVRDRLGYATDNNRDGIDVTIFDSLSTDDDLEWGYRVRTLRVASVTPESAAVIIEIAPRITVRFDGTLTGDVFDTDTGRGNVSFHIGSGRTGYSSLRSVQYLADSTGIIIQPKTAFFSNDSVYCTFTGFTSQYRYANQTNLPEDTSKCFSSYSWYFRSGEIGFYTFPNPYKPGADPRHCSNNGPCGIWFKNLHTLAKECDEVVIRIYTMNAHPIFDSRKKGLVIRFAEQGTDDLPQWKWDTRNNRGDFVATGIYLYAIFDTKGTLLKKGKLIIAR